MRPLLLALLLVGACAEPPVVLPVEPATIVLTPPPATKGPPATVARVPPIDDTVALPPVTGLDVAARDPRRGSGRSVSLLMNEVSALESLRKATPPSAPDAPLVLRRLAEDYVEMRKANVPPAAQGAIAAYEALVQGYPTYPQMDEVLYDLGLEYEVAGDARNARKMYFDLISHHPTSSLVPFAYFAFGELFLREAKSDASKISLAQAAYAQTLKVAKASLLPDALWRSGQVEDLAGDAASAQSFYDRLKRDHPTSVAASRIGEKP